MSNKPPVDRMQPVLATDPAANELSRIFATAIDGYCEELDFKFRLPTELHVRYKANGDWVDIWPPSAMLCSAVALRLRRTIEMLPAENGQRWLRYQFEKQRSLITTRVGECGIHLSQRTWFVDMQLAGAMSLAGDSWRVRFVIPLFQARRFVKAQVYPEAAHILDELLPRNNDLVTALYAEMLRYGHGMKRDNNRAQLLLRSIEHPDSQWCLIGNITEGRPCGHGGSDWIEGTKHFKPGAKVYCTPPQWGDGYENIRVVGRHRNNNRYVTMIIKSCCVTNWRAKVVYSPAVIHRLNWAGLMWRSEIIVRSWVVMLRDREAEKKPS